MDKSLDVETFREFMRQSFEDMVKTFPDSPSRDAVVRQLREIQDELAEALARACQNVQKEIRDFLDCELQAKHEIMDICVNRAREVFDRVKSSQSTQEIQEGTDEIMRLTKGMRIRIDEFNKPQTEFIKALVGKFEAELAAIVEKLKARGRAAIAAGLIADVALLEIDPDRSTKQ